MPITTIPDMFYHYAWYEGGDIGSREGRKGGQTSQLLQLIG